MIKPPGVNPRRLELSRRPSPHSIWVPRIIRESMISLSAVMVNSLRRKENRASPSSLSGSL